MKQNQLIPGADKLSNSGHHMPGNEKLCPGGELAGYRILEHLADGHFSRVYLAANIRDNNKYALKVYPASSVPPYARADAMVMTELDHPGIVRVRHFGEHRNFFTIVMDFVEGPSGKALSLENLLQMETRLNQPYTALIASQICDALGHAHGRGVIHAALSPASILIDRRGDARLINFSRELNPQLHKLDYLAPEIYGNLPPDHSSDLYSLGIIIYQCLTGRLPKGNWKNPSKSGLNTCWDNIIARLLEPDPRDRYQSAAELRHDLDIARQACLSNTNRAIPIPARRRQLTDTHDRPQALSDSTPRIYERRRDSRFFVFAAIVALAALTGLSFFLQSRGERVSGKNTVRNSPLFPSLPVEGSNWTVPGINMPMIYVLPGSFVMGSDNPSKNELLRQVVDISRGFWIGKYEVTQQQYHSVTNENPSHFRGETLPVENVTWFDAVRFCQLLTARERDAQHIPGNYEFRLPTEAEWEYAARGGSGVTPTLYSGGDNPDQFAWYDINSGRATREAGMKAPNKLGIHDMSGNVCEWCLDRHDIHVSQPQNGSADDRKVNRGGCWYFIAESCTVNARFYDDPSRKFRRVGFRVILVKSSH